MDIPRPDQSKARLKKRILLGGVAALALIGITVLLARLKPAAPTVERNTVYIDTVKRGPMVRQVRGLGTLVPEEISWIAARTQGRVDKIILRPGAIVQPDSVILMLVNPDVIQAASGADSQLTAAEAELENLKVQLQSGVLAAESTAATAKAEYEQAKLRAEVNEQLFKDGLVSPLDLRLSRVTAEQAETRNNIEQKRYAFAKDSTTPQLAVKAAEVDRLRAQAKLRHDELDALTVRAGMSGVLQLLPVEVGAQVQPGANLARVADPARLKAEVHIAETQAKIVTDMADQLKPYRLARREAILAALSPARSPLPARSSPAEPPPTNLSRRASCSAPLRPRAFRNRPSSSKPRPKTPSRTPAIPRTS